MGSLLADLKQAFWLLRKNPLFTSIAAGTLALGIGSCTAILSFADAVYLRALPFPKPAEIVEFQATTPQGDPRSPALYTYLHWRERRPTEVLAADQWIFRTMTGPGDPESLYGSLVTLEYFPMLGVRVSLGRGFQESDYLPAAEPVVLLSDKLWKKSFGGSPQWIGKQIRLDARLHTVIGILPEGLITPSTGDP